MPKAGTPKKSFGTGGLARQFLEAAARDLRFALRALVKSPGLSLTLVLTLAVGIGANTAIFSLLDVIALRPLPGVRSPERLVRIATADATGTLNLLPSTILDPLRNDPLLDGVCGVVTPLSTVQISDTLQALSAHALSGDCYQMLGIRPAIGRLFTRADDIRDGPRVAVLSYRFWQSEFHGDPGVIGRAIRIEGEQFTVIGVTEPSFQGMLLGFPPRVSFPLSQWARPGISKSATLAFPNFVFARMKPGVTREQVQTQLAVQWHRMLRAALPPSTEADEILRERLVVAPGANGLDYTLRREFRSPLVALLAISGLVLLISCVNVANLLLAKGLQRRREIAVRLALGARRWDVARQFAIESAALLIAGTMCALLIARPADRLLLSVLARARTGLFMDVPLDTRVMLFTVLAAAAAMLFFGVLPARQSSAVSPAEALKAGTASPGHSYARLRKMLASAQVALSFVLVLAASIFTQSLRTLRDQPMGFRVNGILNLQLMPLPGGYGQKFAPASYYRNLLDQIDAVPGVEAASLSHSRPLWIKDIEEIGDVNKADTRTVSAATDMVTDTFFATLGISLLQGKNFSRADAPGAPQSAILSESLAKQLFGPAGALGKHIRLTEDGREAEVIGVAADTKLADPHARQFNLLYLNYWQSPVWFQEWPEVEIRYAGSTASVISGARRELQAEGHEYAESVSTMADQLDMVLLRERLLASLGIVFGLIALLLAGIGLFGLLSFFVSSRAKEMAVRMALGAQRQSIAWLILRGTLLLMVPGLLIGIPLAYVMLRGISGLLFGVGPMPVEAVSISAALLLSVAVAAALIPVRRAAATDPMAVLRHE
ncbi:MAG TPA: ABC transporter permease [Candidatus Acidoferrales bacterium]|nr:ABC transporter permease [Candidatus Acidoferrales bacterium]